MLSQEKKSSREKLTFPENLSTAARNRLISQVEVSWFSKIHSNPSFYRCPADLRRCRDVPKGLPVTIYIYSDISVAIH